MDFVEALTIAIPPPADTDRYPIAPDMWARFEEHDGSVPPRGYRAIFDRWGTGEWGWSVDGGSRFYFEPPFSPQGLIPGPDESAQIHRELRDEYPDLEPDFPVWPEPGGWLPFGGHGDGGWTVGWFRDLPDPDQWPIGVWGRGGAELSYRLDMGAAEFLYRLMTSSFGNSLDRMADGEPCFYPYASGL